MGFAHGAGVSPVGSTSRNLRDWAVATAIAWLVASAAFFVHRNREYRAMTGILIGFALLAIRILLSV